VTVFLFIASGIISVQGAFLCKQFQPATTDFVAQASSLLDLQNGSLRYGARSKIFNKPKHRMRNVYMRTYLQAAFVIVVLALAGCVGTDYIADPFSLKPARIEVVPGNLALEVGKTTAFQATYYDSLGNRVFGTAFNWASSDPATAAIDANGAATTLKAGQARITAQARNVTSAPALLTVVADPNQVATVVVTPDNGSLAVGGTLQFTASARNLSGAALSGKTFTWRSSQPAIATVSNAGLATALATGQAQITATVDNVESSVARLSVVSTSRSGPFTKRPNTSYNVSGAATLEQQPSGALVLKLGEDFSSSNGPGLEVFLSATNTVGANSISLGRLQKTSGAQSYNVPSAVTLTTYDWVIIHCVPFNATFGYAQLR